MTTDCAPPPSANDGGFQPSPGREADKTNVAASAPDKHPLSPGDGLGPHKKVAKLAVAVGPPAEDGVGALERMLVVRIGLVPEDAGVVTSGSQHATPPPPGEGTRLTGLDR